MMTGFDNEATKKTWAEKTMISVWFLSNAHKGQMIAVLKTPRKDLSNKDYPSRRKCFDAENNYFEINFQIANANLWAGVINYVRSCNCECDFLAHAQWMIFEIVSDV